MKSVLKKGAAIVLAMVIAFAGMSSVGAQAKEEGTKDAQKYNYDTYKYVVQDFSRRVTGQKSTVDVECYSMRLELSGYGKAGKKINKFLKTVVACDPDPVFDYAEFDADNSVLEKIETYHDRVGSWVEYNDGKYLSVTVSRDTWYGGAVENTFLTGYTFDLKTGKAVPITKATGWTLKQIKKRISDNMKADGGYFEENFAYLESLKASDFRYYLKDGNRCYVTFGPYEIGAGGWFRQFDFEF